ncbi:T9SS type A sorting domain-containing protein [Polaribacter gochangensis]|uniref:T9SS type A sorting domain-containing protein n=1 Tax=Polaribacter gochangensis TaxID=3252903 RepID=UPI0039048AC8
MKKNYLLTFAVLLSLGFITFTAITELKAPDVEEVYGGRINYINGYKIHADSTRILIATESANSVFYADMYTTNSGTPSATKFKLVPSLDNTQNFGSRINNIQIHEPSEQFVFINENNDLYSTTIGATAATNTGISGVGDILINGDYTFAAGASNMHFGSLDAAGSYTTGTGSPISFPTFSDLFYLNIDATSKLVYAFGKGATPKLYVSTDMYDAFNATTTFTDISPTLTSPSVTWTAFGIAPDGRFFLSGNNGSTKFIAYSDDNGTTWSEFDTTITGVSATNFSFSGTASSYYVLTATMFSNNKGVSGTWAKFGTTSHYTHPNDGAVFVDPNNSNIFYATSDQGLGISFDKGINVSSADDGIEAVQVNDMEMTADKTTGWIASKSGVRKVTTYTTTPSWTNAMFPTGDGSGYHSIAMKPSDDNTAYAGNVRIYKTTDSGTNWSRVFTPESAPYNFPSVGTMAKAITICPYNENIVFAGFEIKDADKGGLFISEDAGVTWTQQLLHSSSSANDVDVRDIVFTQESGVITAYVGVDYDLSSPTGRSIYKVTKGSSSWTVTRDMDAATTSTGTTIVVTINDLDYESTNNTVYATGTDAGTNHPVSYYKPLSGTGKWTVNTTSGFPFVAGKEGKATTYGIDTLYCAVDNEIYYLAKTASAWAKGYTYPNGTRINFLYYDDLLVGTDTGLYSQIGPGNKTASVDENSIGKFSLYPNPIAPNEVMTINYSTDIKDLSIKLFTVHGQLINDYKGNIISKNSSEIKYKIPKLKPGIYLLKLFDANKGLSTKKIVIK